MKATEAANHGIPFPQIDTTRAQEDQLVSLYFLVCVQCIYSQQEKGEQWEIPGDPWNFPFARTTIPNHIQIHPAWNFNIESDNQSSSDCHSPAVPNWIDCDDRYGVFFFGVNQLNSICYCYLISVLFIFRFFGIIRFVMHWYSFNIGDIRFDVECWCRFNWNWCGLYNARMGVHLQQSFADK